jgi:hypothetical protein
MSDTQDNNPNPLPRIIKGTSYPTSLDEQRPTTLGPVEPQPEATPLESE